MKLHKRRVKLYAYGPTTTTGYRLVQWYGSTKPLPVIGWFNGMIETKNKIDAVKFYVVHGNNMNSSLGLETVLTLGIIQIVNCICLDVRDNTDS